MGAIAIHGFGWIGRSTLKAALAGQLFMVSVAAWFDNELGYATRLAETAQILAGVLAPA